MLVATGIIAYVLFPVFNFQASAPKPGSTLAHSVIAETLARRAHPELEDCVWAAYRDRRSDGFIAELEVINPNRLTDYERARRHWFFTDVDEGAILVDTGEGHPCRELWTAKITAENDSNRNHDWAEVCRNGLLDDQDTLPPQKTWEGLQVPTLSLTAERARSIRIGMDKIAEKPGSAQVRTDCSRYNPQLLTGRWVVLGEPRQLR